MANLNLKVLIKAVAELKPVTQMAAALGRLARPARAAGMVFKSIGRDLLMIGTVGVAAVSALGLGLWGLIRRTADAGDAALLAAQKTGVQIEAYQRLAYAAKMGGVEAEGFDTGLKFLNISMDAAANGSKQDIKAFRALGISLKDAEGKARSTEDVMIAVADQFEKMPDGPRKTAIAMALFGRSGVDLIPMLNEGGAAIRRWGQEAQAAGLVMSEQAARDADEFNDSLDRLKMGGMGLANSLLSGLLPQLTALIEKARLFIAANKPAVIAQMTNAITQMAAAAPKVIEALMAIVNAVVAISRVVGPVVSALGGFRVVLDLLAVLMVGRLAIAIWTAVKAVWGLNVAMAANPIGLVIIAIAGLIAVGWLLYRNWDRVVAWIKKAWGGIVAWFKDLGVKMKGAFKLAIDALWQMLPPWIRMLFRGAKFALNVVRNNLNGPGDPASPGGPNRRIAPSPRLPGAQNGVVRHEVLVQDGRAPSVRTRTSGNVGPVTTTRQNYRGGGVD